MHTLIRQLTVRGGNWRAVNVTGSRYGVAMTAPPPVSRAPTVIHLGGEAAAIVPLGDLRQLQAVQRHAPPELLEEADVEATLAAHGSGWRQGGPERSRTRRRWPSCSASSEDRVSPAARASARRYMADQDGMRAIGAAVAALALDPYRRRFSPG